MTLAANFDFSRVTVGVIYLVLFALAVVVYRATRIPPRKRAARRPQPKAAVKDAGLSDAQFDAIVAETSRFMAQRERWRMLATVRGKVNFEWGSHIDQLKREGKLEEALQLTYECMDASERADDSAGDGSSTWAGWAERACIILRKMGDFEAEERLLQCAVAKLPDRESLVNRLAKAAVLAERARQREVSSADGAEQ